MLGVGELFAKKLLFRRRRCFIVKRFHTWFELLVILSEASFVDKEFIAPRERNTPSQRFPFLFFLFTSHFSFSSVFLSDVTFDFKSFSRLSIHRKSKDFAATLNALFETEITSSRRRF